MNITPDLPYVDLTGFHTYAKPGFPFVTLASESQEEDDRLKSLLNVGELIEGLKLEEPELGAIALRCELHPVALTEAGQLVAVALKFATTRVPPKKKKKRTRWVQEGSWDAFVVLPEDYEALQEEVESGFAEYRHHLENVARGMEQKN